MAFVYLNQFVCTKNMKNSFLSKKNKIYSQKNILKDLNISKLKKPLDIFNKLHDSGETSIGLEGSFPHDSKIRAKLSF